MPGIVGVRRTEQSAGIINLTSQSNEKHCGFVINRGNASAAEVMELMRQVEDKVEENSGVRLEAEVRRIGEF